MSNFPEGGFIYSLATPLVHCCEIEDEGVREDTLFDFAPGEEEVYEPDSNLYYHDPTISEDTLPVMLLAEREMPDGEYRFYDSIISSLDEDEDDDYC